MMWLFRSQHQAAATRRAWCVDDGEVGAELVLDLDDDLLGPELVLPLQPRVLVLDVLLTERDDCLSAHPLALGEILLDVAHQPAWHGRATRFKRRQG